MAESESDEEATKTQRVMVQTYDDGYRAGYEAAKAQAAGVAQEVEDKAGGTGYSNRKYGPLAVKAAILAMEPRDENA